MNDGRPTLMQVNPGITEPNLTSHPLGFESEMSAGPSDINPYRSAQEAEMVEEIERKQRERRDGKLFKTKKGTKDLNDDVRQPALPNFDIDIGVNPYR